MPWLERFGIYGVPDLVVLLCFGIIIGAIMYARRSPKDIVEGIPFPNLDIYIYRSLSGFKAGSIDVDEPDDHNEYNQVGYLLHGNFQERYDELKRFMKRIYSRNKTKVIMGELGSEIKEYVIPRESTPFQNEQDLVEGNIDRIVADSQIDLNFIVEEAKGRYDENFEQLLADGQVQVILKNLSAKMNEARDVKEKYDVFEDMLDYMNTTTETTINYLPEEVLNMLEWLSCIHVFWWKKEDQEKYLICLSPHKDVTFIKSAANIRKHILEVYSPPGHVIKTLDKYGDEIHIHLGLLYPLQLPLELFSIEVNAFTRLPTSFVLAVRDLVEYADYFQKSRINEALSNLYCRWYELFFGESERGRIRQEADTFYARVERVEAAYEQATRTPKVYEVSKKAVEQEGKLKNIARSLPLIGRLFKDETQKNQRANKE